MRLIDQTGLTVTLVPPDLSAGSTMATLIVKGTFALAPDKPCVVLPRDAQRPIEGEMPHMDELGRSPRWPSDLSPPKPHTDVLVIGHAHAPGGQPLPSWEAGFDCGPLSRRLRVFGPRFWTAAGEPSPAEPRLTVPLRWELAFGGLSDPRNPFGRGIEPDASGRCLLPQIERPEQLIRTRADRPEPANFGPVPAFFPARQRLAGTRDQRWSLFRAPLPPDDFDPAFHNVAPIEQQAGDHPRGDETLVLHGLHPRHPVLATALPGMRPRAVALRGEGPAEEHSLALDTIVVLPDEEQLVLVWRGAIPDPEPDILLVAVEALGAPGKLEELAQPALAAREAARAPDPAAAAAAAAQKDAAIAATQAEGMAEIAQLLKDVPLPAEIRAMAVPGGDPMALADALITHLENEIRRLGGRI